MIWSRLLRKINGTTARSNNRPRRSTRAQQNAATRPRLEQLEDRVTPATIDTITNVAISITPNIVSHTASETLTVTVLQAGTTTPVTSGSVFFNVNGQTGNAGVNSSGQATFTTTLPLIAVVRNQTAEASYGGATVGTDIFNSSMFLSPVYLNELNAVSPSQITFGTPPASTTSNFASAGGESDDINLLGVVAVDFNYIDPGTINNFSIGGFTLPGSLATTLFENISFTVYSTIVF